jgi:hypothetical protein
LPQPPVHTHAVQQLQESDSIKELQGEKLHFREVEVVKAVYMDKEVVLSRREGKVAFDRP